MARLDLQLSLAAVGDGLLSALPSKEKNVQSIAWQLMEPNIKQLGQQSVEARLQTCKERIDEWNEYAMRKRGERPYVFNLNRTNCLATAEEKNEKYRKGVPIDIDPNPEGKNQSWGGRASGPLVPAPPHPRDNEWTSEETVVITVPASRLVKNHSTNRRAKRNDGQTTEEIELKCKRTEFDLRKAFPACSEIIGNIRYQRGCNSCAFVSTASALTDRACILYAKKIQEFGKKPIEDAVKKPRRYASARDAMECAYDHVVNCEDGGMPSAIWQYYSTKGTVNEKCKPYMWPITADDSEDLAPNNWDKQCHSNCDTKTEDNGSLDLLTWGLDYKDKISYDKPMNMEDWRLAKLYAGTLYTVSETRVVHGTQWQDEMMNEIKTNGSIVAVFAYYDDLAVNSAKKPYEHNPKLKADGSHAVRLIGYGETKCPGMEQPGKHWLAANSWGSDWNDDGGVFRIVRGTDESGIESIEVSWGQLFFPFWGDE